MHEPAVADAVRTGRRAITWRADAPATVCWTDALDGGDPRKPAAFRDAVSCTAAPFARPTRLIELADGPRCPVTKPRVLWDRSSEDRYHDPGRPVLRDTPSGHAVLQITSKGQLLLTGAGASDQGDRPFYDRLDLATGATERIWRSEDKRYSAIAGVLDPDGLEVVLTHESPTEPPQLFAYSFVDRAERALTHFAHPVPELAKVTAQLVRWKRKDGLELSGMLYLPPGFRPQAGPPAPGARLGLSQRVQVGERRVGDPEVAVPLRVSLVERSVVRADPGLRRGR